MRIRKVRFQYCEFAKKEVAIHFDEEPLENGNGRDKVFEMPVRCSESNCPNAQNCVYMQEKSYWK